MVKPQDSSDILNQLKRLRAGAQRPTARNGGLSVLDIIHNHIVDADDISRLNRGSGGGTTENFDIYQSADPVPEFEKAHELLQSLIDDSKQIAAMDMQRILAAMHKMIEADRKPLTASMDPVRSFAGAVGSNRKMAEREEASLTTKADEKEEEANVLERGYRLLVEYANASGINLPAEFTSKHTGGSRQK